MVADGSKTPAVVVTGAASGIGQEIARLAAGEGHFMVLVDRSKLALDRLADELAAAGVATESVCVDLLDASAADMIENALSKQRLYCEVLVNSAGAALFGAAAHADRGAQLDVLGVNARALTELTLRFLPGMVARGRGGVLNVGSVTAYTPGPNMAVYYATKAYVRSFSLALAAEVAGTGVTVTCLSPGVVRTPLLQDSPASQTRLYKIVPRTSAKRAAIAGWRGFRAGKGVVIPHPLDRVIAVLSKYLPSRALARLVAALQKEPRRS